VKTSGSVRRRRRPAAAPREPEGTKALATRLQNQPNEEETDGDWSARKAGRWGAAGERSTNGCLERQSRCQCRGLVCHAQPNQL